MMNDARIAEYRRAVVEMAKGDYPHALPVDGGDELGRLGTALLGLSRTLERRVAEQKLLHEVTKHANAGLLLSEVLDQLYVSFRGLIPYQRIGLALLEDEGRVLRARWARSDSSQIHLNVGFSASIQGSSLQTILATVQPRILNDLEEYLQANPDSTSTRLIVNEGVRSSLTCPLVAIGKPVGFLFFSSFAKNTYRHAHVELFMQIADQLSSIVEKSRLYEELRHANSELKQARDQLAFLAAHDSLTGLGNRRTLDDHLQREWDRAIRSHSPISAVMMDIDSFKLYNDRHGHLAGDECLQAVARVIAEAARRPADCSARYGGEEFALLLPETDAEGALNRAEQARAEVEALRIPHGRSVASAVITISAGVATVVPDFDSSPSVLLSAADEALYHAKQSGRNQVCMGEVLAAAGSA